MFWTNDYLMVVYEIEKARRDRQDLRKEEPSTAGGPQSAISEYIRELLLRRKSP